MTVAELIEILRHEPKDAVVQALGTEPSGRNVWNSPNFFRDTADDGRRILFLDGDPA